MPLRRRPFKYASDIRRVCWTNSGVPASGGGSVTPADLTPALWLRATSATVSRGAAPTDAQSVVSDGQQIKWLIDPRDSFGQAQANKYADGTAAGPTLEIAAGKYWVHGGNGLSMTLSAAVACAADFVAYAVVKKNAAEFAIMLGNDGTNGTVKISDSDELSVANDAGSLESNVFAVGSGSMLTRVRRVSGTVFVAATGAAEANCGTVTGNVTFNEILANANDGSSNANSAIGELLIFTGASVPTAPQLASLDQTGGYFDTNAYLGSAAWGVHL